MYILRYINTTISGVPANSAQMNKQLTIYGGDIIAVEIA